MVEHSRQPHPSDTLTPELREKVELALADLAERNFQKQQTIREELDGLPVIDRVLRQCHSPFEKALVLKMLGNGQEVDEL